MTYTCKDCSHQSTKKFPNGKCPACDSYNIITTNKLPELSTQERKPKTKIEIVIVVILWGLIGYGAWNKYYRHDDAVKPAHPTAASNEPKSQDPTIDY
jgi:hypothetical protein